MTENPELTAMAIDPELSTPRQQAARWALGEIAALTARADLAEAALATARDDGIEAARDLIQRVADGYAAGGDGAIACALYLTAVNVRTLKGGDDDAGSVWECVSAHVADPSLDVEYVRADLVAALVEAANQARLAFAGYVSVQSAIDKLDDILAAMKGGE